MCNRTNGRNGPRGSTGISRCKTASPLQLRTCRSQTSRQLPGKAGVPPAPNVDRLVEAEAGGPPALPGKEPATCCLPGLLQKERQHSHTAVLPLSSVLVRPLSSVRVRPLSAVLVSPFSPARLRSNLSADLQLGSRIAGNRCRPESEYFGAIG